MSEIVFNYNEQDVPITGFTPVFDEKGKQVDTITHRAVLDGVPMRDLTEQDYLKLPKRLQRAVKSAPYFVPTAAAASLPDPDAEEKPTPATAIDQEDKPVADDGPKKKK